MARRPSTVSLSSLSSSTATGLSKLAQLPPLTHSVSQNSNTSGEGSSQWLPNRKVSVSGSLKSSFEPNGYSDNLDPDELFAKHTVAEVRAIQQRLRVDADAKQQELRLMVGERYRDLLQASTSIIEIAQSSVNVKDAFQEMRNVSASMRQAHLPKSSTVAGDEDIYLHALQSLSAHMKLLLDAPEHLWRLIEKRRYLHAAWLFLLSRVVHQALLVAEDDEDAQWSAYGILVPEQFPLVQRQWDIVSQFRTQVTHKATLFLREHTLSSSDACAALLTLHLLESRPLPETVTIFLTQRTRALTTLLNRSRSIANGAADANLFTDAGPRRTSKASVRGVRQKSEAALRVVSQTLGTARTIFLGGALHPTSLMAEVLNYISTEAPPSDWVPHDLRFTTQTLLASLPSSTHYGLLPSNIKGYKPYIDDNTISTSKIHVQVEEQMQDWFRDALQDLEKAVDNWLSELKTIREVWYLRSQLRTWVDKGEGLVHDEKLQFTSTVENWCQKRTRQIWRSEIDAAKLAFQERLASTLESDRDSLNLNLSGVRTSQNVFHPPPLPSLQNSLTSSTGMASFEKYRKSLQQQILGRTTPLNNVMETVEVRIQALHADLDFVQKDSTSTESTDQLFSLYRHDAESLCEGIVSLLLEVITSLGDVSERSIGSVVFVGRVAAELSLSTLLRSGMDCSQERLQAFKESMKTIHDQTLDRWREYAVQDVIRKHWLARRHHPHTRAKDKAGGPSPAMLGALVSLSSSMQELGSSLDPVRRRSWSTETLDSFAQAVLERVSDDTTNFWQGTLQSYWDLRLLLQICKSWEGAEMNSLVLLRRRVDQLRDQLSTEGVVKDALEDKPASDHLSRMQMLLESLLPSSPPSSSPSSPSGKSKNSSSMLRFGVPPTDSQFEHGINVVKPALRLGLLLVGS